MARDYKRSRRKKSRQGVPGWAWMLTGLMLGLVVALVVYVQLRPQAEIPKLLQPQEAAKATEALRPAPRVQKKPEEPAVEKPRFDFYSILPNLEVVIPEEEASANKAATAPPAKVTPIEKPGTYILQVGSFRQHEEADRMKAELALLGVSSSIETVTINNTETWHRVRVGPSSNLEQLNQVRQRLRESNIDAVLLKLKT